MVPQLRSFLRPAALAAAAAATLLLASCGGGGSGDAAPAAPAAPAFPPSASLANMCTIEGQQKFVRSYLDETYLWYNEIPTVNAAEFATVPAYFNALLVKTPDANGQPRDRFSAVLTSAGANALQSLVPDGAAIGDGVPANLLGLTNKSVPLSTVVVSATGRKVGYILFNDHNEGAQDALISAFETVRAAGATELVLDMRFNAGGFLYVAQTAASMVAGPQSEGRIFEQLHYSAKRQAETNASTFFFSSRVQTPESVYPRGAALPQLNLPRVYVLSSSQTCSASESVINSLRGIDVEVILVGDTTCGKPYGFHRQDNCGLAFFAIEFQGYNAKNFGDYTTGFKATCPVADNFSSTLGSAQDPLFAGALQHIDTGSCPPAPAPKSALAQSRPGAGRENAPLSSPLLDGRKLRPAAR